LPRFIDPAGEDMSGPIGIGQHGFDFENAFAQALFEMSAHAIEHGVHAVLVQRHRHAIGRMRPANALPGR
jgi:hypothetical protein